MKFVREIRRGFSLQKWRATKLKVFLKMAVPTLHHYQLAQKKMAPKNHGKAVYFTRYARLAIPASALSEGSATANEVTSLTATNVSTTIVEEGAFTKVASLFDMVTIDENLKGLIEVMAKQAGETIDSRCRNETALNFASKFANKLALSAIVASDVLDATQVKLAVRTLNEAFALRREDGNFTAVITPGQAYDLMSETGTGGWLDVNKYTSTTNTYNGEIGKLYGVRFIMSPIGYRSATSATTYSSSGAAHYAQFYGSDAFGVVGIEGIDPTKPKIIVKNSDNSDTSNPLSMFSTVGWKVPMVAKTLNSAFGVSYRT